MVAPKVWFARLLALTGVRLAPLSADILIDSAFLSGTPPKDPADRIVAATARSFGHVLITRDSELIPYGRQGHIRTLAC